MRKNLQTGYILLVFSFSFVGCTLNDPGPVTSEFPLTLTADQDFSLTKLNWNPVNVTGFKEYLILQSTREIPASPEPEISSEVSILKRIDDPDITSFLTSDILFTQDVCYKLYVAIDDRFLQSGNVCVQPDFEIFDGFYDRATHKAGGVEVTMYDRVNRLISIYNLETGEITSTVNDNNVSFPVLDVSSWNGITNLFTYDQSPGRLRKYNYPSLTSTMFKDFNTVLWAAKSYNQFIFTSAEESGKAFKVLNRSNLSEVDSEQSILGNRNIAVFEGTPTRVIEVGENRIQLYDIDQTGEITFISTVTPGIPQLQTQNFTAQGNELFISGRLGNIINRNGENLGSLTSGNNSLIQMSRLTEDEKKVVYVVNDNTNIRLEVADITNLSNITTVGSYNIPFANYSDIIIDGNLIYLMGVSFASGSAQTFILKYSLS